MHVHLPKGFHGWREFAKEVGIIVLGVLIALGFEQLVQMWHWRQEARMTRQELTSELSYDALFAGERVAIEECLRDRIKDLTAKLNNAGGHWTADPMVFGKPRKPIGGNGLVTAIPMAYRAPRRPFLSDGWDTAKSSAVLDHMSRDDVHDFEFTYKGVGEIRTLEDEESTLEPQLSFLSFDQTLNPQSRVQALVVLARLDMVNSDIALIARQMLAGIRSMGLQLMALRRLKRVQKFESRSAASCRRIAIGSAAAYVRHRLPESDQAAGSSRFSPARRRSAACSFSNARTSIWRMRSRLTP